jgi:hypothetical protein
MVLRRFGQPKKQESKGSLKGPLSRPRWRRGTMKAPRRPVDYGEEGRELGQHFVSKLLFLFVLSTFEFIIAGDDEYIGNKGHIISDLAFEVYDGKVYPDCTFFCFLYLFLFFYFYFVFNYFTTWRYIDADAWYSHDVLYTNYINPGLVDVQYLDNKFMFVYLSDKGRNVSHCTFIGVAIFSIYVPHGGTLK